MATGPKTIDEFKEFVNGIEMPECQAFALGLAIVHDGNIIDAVFPTVNARSNFGSAAVLYHYSDALAGTDDHRVIDLDTLDGSVRETFSPFKGDGKTHANIDAIKRVVKILKKSKGRAGHGRHYLPVVAWIKDLRAEPKDVLDAKLRLALLSHRAVRPQSIQMGVFGKLPNVAWTSEGPLALERVDGVRDALLAKGQWLHVFAVDKFGPLLDRTIPSGVRVGDASRVREGAHLADGTVVMHEGFVNFNAGTLGTSMVEGRISAGVVVGDGSDIGGGASIMGTLSGGGKEVISVGERSLLGANSGLGFPLGDDCVVEAGLYVTAGTKVTIIGETGDNGDPLVVKAVELSGKNGLLFRRNSTTGSVEVMVRKGHGVELNSVLHDN